MNRLIRNRDILVIVLLIVIICLFNFHISHGDRGPGQPVSVSNKVHFKSKAIPDEHNISQLNSILQNPNNDSNNLTVSNGELLTTLQPITTNKQSFFNEIISSKDFWKICGDKKSSKINITLDEELYKSNINIDCQTGSAVVFLVISQIDNYKYREKIRQSWGSVRQLHELKLTTLFFVYSDRAITEKQKNDLKSENDQYFDVVYIPVHYGMKTEVDFYLKMFQFSVFSCMKTEYFVLINDATFVNLPTLFETILTNKDSKTSAEEKKSIMLCKPMRNVVAVRNKKSSWYVSNKDWSEKHYPTYCDLSSGVIMSQEVIRDLLMCSFYQKKFWINDVFITGILPLKVSVSIEAFMDDYWPNVMKNHYIHDDLTHSIFLTNGWPYNDRVWRLMFSKSLREF